jgi:hypothetical protein
VDPVLEPGAVQQAGQRIVLFHHAHERDRLRGLVDRRTHAIDLHAVERLVQHRHDAEIDEAHDEEFEPRQRADQDAEQDQQRRGDCRGREHDLVCR